jgi:RNA polymerase-binding transcription factor DksA
VLLKQTEAIDKRRAHQTQLARLRAETVTRRDTAAAEYETLDHDSGDVGAGDDEGGGEADVTSAERDRLRAAIEVADETLHAIDAALTRSQTDHWDRCTRCGDEIGAARLEAIPSTDRCVSCKAADTSV